MNELDQLSKQVKQCSRCPLRQGATQPVMGIGEVGAKYFIIGEAPGREEDAQGIPFVGMAGKRLNQLLELAKIDVNDCYISNVVKCRPPENRMPKKAERLSCYQWLKEELRIVYPENIITLGATPLSLFTDNGITQMHGTQMEITLNGITVNLIAQYHPAAALHQPRLWAILLDDWQNLPQKVNTHYIVVQALPITPMISLDTETDNKGGLGQWSVATRGQDDKLYVASFFGYQPDIHFLNTVVFHNAKYDLRELKSNGMPTPKNFHDSMIMAYCLGLGRQETRDSNKSGDKMVGGLGLKYLARRHLGMQMKSWQEVKDHPEEVEEYNAQDSIGTYLLAEKWLPILPKHYFDIDMPLLPVLMTIEDRGIQVDPNFLQEYAKTLDETLSGIDLNGINAFSHKQVSEYVYGTLGFTPTKFTENKEPSVDAEVLEQIDDPIVKRILQYREVYKERKTYVSSYANRMDLDNRIHCEFKQVSTVTGRLSSSRPNLQNVTKGTALRKLFIPKEGCLLVRLDWERIEFGWLAVLAKDEELLEAFLHGDIHQQTADALEVERDIGKHINFQIQNGGTPWGMSKEYGIPIDLAKEYFDKYYKRFPAIKRYHDEVVAKARETKKVTGYFGRTRRIDAYFSNDWRVRKDGDREAMTMPMQNGAAEMVKLSMIDLHQKHQAPMLIQVHDEILFEVPEKDAKEYAHWLKEYVPKIVPIEGVEFPVAVSIGKNWQETMNKEANV